MTQTRRRGRAAVLALVLTTAAGLAAAGPAGAGAGAGATTQLISVTGTGGTPEEGVELSQPAVSEGGRFVAFTTEAPLSPDDVNRRDDVYLRDRRSQKTVRVSVPYGPRRADGESGSPQISADGRYVAFASAATTLVPGTSPARYGVFVRDLATSRTVQADVTPSGRPGNGSSDDDEVSLTRDGRYLAFTSNASDLVAGDVNGSTDIFVRDLATSTTRRVSLTDAGTESNGSSFHSDISPDGTKVTFSSRADDLVPGDTNGITDVFVRDLTSGTTERVSLTSTGAQATGRGAVVEHSSTSADGRTVAFESNVALDPSDTNTWSDVYVHDRDTGTTALVSRTRSGGAGNSSSSDPTVTDDGSSVCFSSWATDLGAGGSPGVFVRDLAQGTNRLVSLSTAGQPSGGAVAPGISGSGRHVAFVTTDALVAQDRNDYWDVYLRTPVG